MIRLILDGIASEWCSFAHGGGYILRDPSGRVNWQCGKCGRWAQHVPEGDEANLLKQHFKRRRPDASRTIAGEPEREVK